MKSTKTKEIYQRIEYTKGRYFFHFDAHEENGVVMCQEQDFRNEPTEAQLRKVVDEYYNKICNTKILEGMQWGGKQIWLSIENQTNYSLAYNLAVQTEGKTLPYRVKCYDENGIGEYINITTVEEFTTFILAMQKHIDTCIEECWQNKDKEFQVK